MKMLNTSIYENRINKSMDKCKYDVKQTYRKDVELRKDCGAICTLGNNLIKLIRHRVPNIRMMLLVNGYCVLCFLCHITMLNKLAMR